MLRLWLDSGAAYPGTYAALASGVIGGYERNEQMINNDRGWPETKAGADVINRRCVECHHKANRPIPRSLSDEIGFSFWMPNIKDKRIRRNRHIVFNLTRPEKSLMLLAPLAKAAGGHGTCRAPETPDGEGAVFADTTDPGYRTLLAMCATGKRKLDDVKRFSMPGFRPRPEWVREMKFYGVLPESFDLARDPIDVYAVERDYWKSLDCNGGK